MSEAAARAAANPGRVAAAKALVAVDAGEYVEEALERLMPPEGPDRALAWFLAYGVLRTRGRVDAALRPHLVHSVGSLDPEVRAALRVGAFERCFARTPPHAAVSQAVEVARALGVGRAAGLVNAVLRKADLPAEMGRIEGLDHPRWLVDRWTERVGEAATDAWCQRNNLPAVLTVVERQPGSGWVALAEQAGLEPVPVTLHGQELRGVWTLRGAKGPVTAMPKFHDGAFWVQDAAAVAVSDLVPAEPGMRILDACAAPGGKSFRLASRGANVVAVDVNERRLGMVADGRERTGLPVELRRHDWTSGPLYGDERFDAVLVDAPCTGLGIVRRHPEVRWRRQPPDLRRCAEQQTVILAAAATHVRPGGVLVYAVCSPEPEESDEIAAGFEAANPDYRRELSFSSAPPEGDEDQFSAFRWVRA